MIKVLIADDEPLARQTIKLLLDKQSDVNEIIEAADGQQALELARKHQPDIIFLDIQMPRKNGLALAESLPQDSIIIFATAYDQYAVMAFDLNAIDYLLKPFNDDRFYQAFNRAKKQLSEHKVTDYKHVAQLIQHMMDEQDKQFKSRLVIKDPGRIRLIEIEHINYIAGAGNYAEIHLFDNKMILHRETLTALEQQLDPKVFIRIHRSSIVRRSSVCELRPNENGDYTVILKNDEKLTLSRRNKAKIEELLGTR